MDQTTTTPNEIYSKFAGKTVETMGLWAEANQRVLKTLADLTAGTAQEGVRLYAELQQNTMKAMGETPAALPWSPATWQDGYQKAVKLFEGNVQAITRSAERMQASAEQAGKGIQETLTAVAARMNQGF